MPKANNLDSVHSPSSDEEATIVSMDDEIEDANPAKIHPNGSAAGGSYTSGRSGVSSEDTSQASEGTSAHNGVWRKLTMSVLLITLVAVAIGIALGVGLSKHGDDEPPFDLDLEDDLFPEVMQEYTAAHPYIDAEGEEEARRAEIEEEMILSTMEYLSNEDTDAEVYEDDPAFDETLDGRRQLQTDIKFHSNICPDAAAATNCMSINMASVTSDPFIVECGQCMQIDETSGATLDFPGGIHVKGKL